MNVTEGLEKFKAAVLKDVPQFIGSVEYYNSKNQCYCVVGLALRNIGYDAATNEIDLLNLADIFGREFGFRAAPVGCISDEIVRECLSKRRINDTYTIAPAMYVIDRFFDKLEIHADELAFHG